MAVCRMGTVGDPCLLRGKKLMVLFVPFFAAFEPFPEVAPLGRVNPRRKSFSLFSYSRKIGRDE
jgi:hypothetical protein